MVNRTACAAFLLALAAPSWATGEALQDAHRLTGAKALATYDGGCTGGSCGAQETLCEDEACRITRAANGALTTGGLIVTEDRGARPVMSAEVPNPALNADGAGSKDRPGFFSGLFSGQGLMDNLGGATAGVGLGFLLGGPIGALIGGLLGAGGGFFLSKMLAK